MKLAILGSLKFKDYEYLKLRVDKLISKVDKKEIVIYFINQKGVSELAKQYAEENNIEYKGFDINWERYGKMAAFDTISKIAGKSTHAVFFADDSVNVNAIESRLQDDKVEYVTFKLINKNKDNKKENKNGRFS